MGIHNMPTRTQKRSTDESKYDGNAMALRILNSAARAALPTNEEIGLMVDNDLILEHEERAIRSRRFKLNAFIQKVEDRINREDRKCLIKQ